LLCVRFIEQRLPTRAEMLLRCQRLRLPVMLRWPATAAFRGQNCAITRIANGERLFNLSKLTASALAKRFELDIAERKKHLRRTYTGSYRAGAHIEHEMRIIRAGHSDRIHRFHPSFSRNIL
jgi:hypothetical protein